MYNVEVYNKLLFNDAGGSVAWTLSLSESQASTDILKKNMSLLKADTLPIANDDALSLLTVFKRLLSETVTLPVPNFFFFGNKKLIEVSTSSDSLNNIWTVYRTLVESVSGNDILSRAWSYCRTFTEQQVEMDLMRKFISRKGSETQTTTDAMKNMAGKDLAEALMPTDEVSSILFFYRILQDAVGLDDVLKRSSFITLAESAILADTLSTKEVRIQVLLEGIASSDGLKTMPGKDLIESIISGDAVSRMIGFLLSDQSTLSDDVKHLLSKTLKKSLSTGDNLSTLLTLCLTLRDTVTPTDIRKMMFLAVLADSLGAIDVLIKQARTIFPETVTGADDLIRLAAIGAFAEMVTGSDVLARTVMKKIAETMAPNDNLLLLAPRLMNEILSVGDVLKDMPGVPLGEIMTSVDGLVFQAGKIHLDSVTLTEVEKLTITKAISIAITPENIVFWTMMRKFSDQIAESDSVTIANLLLKEMAETVNIEDIYRNMAGKALSEPISSTDTVENQLSRTWSEVLTLADALKNRASKLLTELTHEQDSFISCLGKVLSEDITETDEIPVFGISVVLQELVYQTDSLLKLFARKWSEGITESDALKDQLTKILADNMAVTDAFGFLFQKMMRESIVDSDFFGAGFARTFLNTLAPDDDLYNCAIKSLTDSLGSTDTESNMRTMPFTYSETIASSDALNHAVQKIMQELVSVTDLLDLTYYVITKLYFRFHQKRWHIEFQPRSDKEVWDE